MPRLPTAEDLGTRTPQNQGGVVTGRADFSGFAELGQSIAAVGQSIIDRDQQLAGAKAQSFWLQEKVKMEADLATDTDYKTISKRYEERLRDAQKQAESMVTGPRQAFLREELNQDILQSMGKVQGVALRKEVDFERANLDSTLVANKDAFLTTADPTTRTMLAESSSDLIQSNVDKGFLSAEEGGDRRRAFASDTAIAHLKTIDPMDRIALLQEGNGAAAMLPIEARNDLIKMAVEDQSRLENMAYTRQERQRREEERQLKLVNDEAAKNGDQLLGQGKLTETWIEENRDRLDPADYRHFYDKLRSGDTGVTDIYVYSDLRQRVADGEDVSGEARDALRGGRLKLTDYDKLVTRSEKNAPGASVPNWFKRGEDHIKLALRVSDLNPDPAAAQRQASALDDWNEWASSNPDATDADARQQFMRITKEYALLDYNQITLVKRLPQFAVGGRQKLDIDQTEQATVEAFQRGDISEAEFEKQAELLAQWRAAIEKRQRAAEESN